MEEIISEAPFVLQTSFKLTGKKLSEKKPLIIYLHGYKQNVRLFGKKIANLLSLDAHHLLLQGPYPVYDEKRSRDVEDWGRAWYLYDGRQKQFRKSMEQSARFIDGVIEKVSPTISYSTVTVLGYSMGGYLAGYYALSRPEVVDNLVTIGGRIKTEWFSGKRYKNLNALVLHGTQDESVDASPAQKSALKLKEMGALVTFKTIEEGHRLNEAYVDEARKWLEAVS